MMKNLLSALLLSTALLAAGCGGDEEEAHVDEEGCEHLQEGPAAAVTAAVSGTGPAVSNDHKRYDIALVDIAGGKGGAVSFAVSEATDYVLYMSAPVPVTVTNSSGAAVEFEESATSSSLCTDIKGRHVVPLTVGTHTLTFGPSTLSSVSLVIEESGEHDHAHD
ncbi:hypothetical protein HRD49_19140 [Corallococcus exiguus]|uniref:hypothetical protein n=1 Tax=Corallococcus TaxID=83461 RepID=UPI000EA1BD97|nr:hypothetical protein [Corallococcus sp. AB038B]NPC68437.1 hypothetical protein [Corallococcus exiguus]RKI40157.1 hypothetical protein D7Y27_20865 [Corallococcus sp. AB004]NPD25385.1 hypothetical protein [Corallococcus exiguus]NRD45400.1 hypothetical protein [Corallococcus exiguus]NRD63869.1 hypothetical protein [Corallococcus exiguus]